MDVEWSKYSHAYGSAEDVPDLLRLIGSKSKKDRKKGWFDIWSALCHQNDVYTGTYAAFPAIVTTLKNAPKKQHWEFVGFLAYSEACRHRKRSPAIPKELKEGYFGALKEASALMSDYLETVKDERMFLLGLSLLAAAHQRPKLAAALQEFGKETDCEICGETFKTLGYDLLDF